MTFTTTFVVLIIIRSLFLVYTCSKMSNDLFDQFPILLKVGNLIVSVNLVK